MSEKTMSNSTENLMRNIKITKLTLNIGTGKDQVQLEKAEKLLGIITGKKPVRTVTEKRIAAWGLRPGLPIGSKITLRGKDATILLPKLLFAKDNKLSDSNFDDNGNISFGIKEYIDIKDAKYLPEIGSMGLQCAVTLERPGFRIKARKLLNRRIPLHHRITHKESVEFMKKNFGVKMASDEE